MKKTLSILSLLCASLMITAPLTSIAQTTTGQPAATKKVVKKKVAKKNTGKKAIPAAEVDDGEDEGTPDIKVAVAVEYNCELGNKLTIYRNAADPKHIALRWGKTLHRLTNVATTTGADRFENHKYGLVWIGIPAKGMLLDSKKGQQLANECKSPEQNVAPAAAPAANLIAEPVHG
ncbi:hypothetical protein QN379_18405 [Glaciimonas sp. Gout2]|uniref:hypothetical protein n=1 Tax=unclassified Glaciimonas TaxID=2644401 RepID=UPI002AB5AA32|nr:MULTISPECIES: hypothetical protein [unclassified Glaciimonas]MDY7548413.1 hypothetical protein [Glaciimonas sp. CA11.2]MEB0010437.1 hypothetical protein [Glaciimonas sp. Cout2]MEB0083982.1 hypothetical protein [Glaciimonas sp. Gout2]